MQTSARRADTSQKGQVRSRASQQSASLFDHLVGEREQLVRHVKGNRLRSLEDDHKLKFSWLLHR